MSDSEESMGVRDELPTVGSPGSIKRAVPVNMSATPVQRQIWEVNPGTPMVLQGHPIMIRARVNDDVFIGKMKNEDPWYSASLISLVPNPVC